MMKIHYWGNPKYFSCPCPFHVLKWVIATTNELLKIKLITKYVACLLQRNEKGETLLHRACIEGKLKRVKTLVEQVKSRTRNYKHDKIHTSS